MKKFFLLAALAAGTQAAQAQSIAAGTISLGGGIGYRQATNKTQSGGGNTTYSGEFTVRQFTFSPAVGYFVADNLAVGLNVGYVSQGQSYTQTPSTGGGNSDPDPTVTFRIGPYVQYYKMFSEQFGAYGTVGTGYESQTDHSTSYDPYGNPRTSEIKEAGYYAALTPGIVFFPIPKFALSASIGSLGYNRLKIDPPKGANVPSGYEHSVSDFGLSFGLDQLQLGGTFYFGR